jgi:aminoglycoside phosphotransferase (APT) family kinase protein
MPTAWTRDVEADGKKLLEWLRARMPGATDLAMTPLTQPGSSGFSNETLLFELTYGQGGEVRRDKLVARVQPVGFQAFPSYDLGLQFRTMSLLAETDVPVPEMLWLEEEDTSVFGAPFYIMRQVEGRVPSDNPPYHVGGWMTEASPAERESIWWGSIESMSRIHKLDYKAAGFSFLEGLMPGEPGLDASFAHYQNYFDWAACGRSQPTLELGWRYLQQHRPEQGPLGIVWGDARVGNIIYDGTTPAAVIDWEMVTLGSGVEDLAWTIFLDRHHSEGLGQPRLEGFPSYEETVERYEQWTGTVVRDLHYYQVWAGYRFGCVMMRLAQQMHHYELLDEQASRNFELDNTVTRLLAKLLDAPPPSEYTTQPEEPSKGSFGPE